MKWRTSEFEIKDPFEQLWDQGHRSLFQDVQIPPETVRRDTINDDLQHVGLETETGQGKL